KIYCLAAPTREIIRRYFDRSPVEGTAVNASSLADEIINSNVQEIIFFCGDQRRDELPDKLAKHQVRVKEIVVYKTSSTPKRISKNYQAILFFSPSAVKSFFSINTIPED